MAGIMMAPRIATARARENLDRVNALIARMTIEEKAGQLNLQDDPFRWRPEGVNPGDALDDNQEQKAADIRAGRVGALFNGVGAGTRVWFRTWRSRKAAWASRCCSPPTSCTA